jgi:hypothetical protein
MLEEKNIHNKHLHVYVALKPDNPKLMLPPSPTILDCIISIYNQLNGSSGSSTQEKKYRTVALL